jgi:predicted nucleotidyltransferase
MPENKEVFIKDPRAGLRNHLYEADLRYDQNQIVGIFLQGSQNYGLDTEKSDIDTKLILTPSFFEVAMNVKPVSTTHILTNDEHLDAKDIRLYMETFRKQNLNFLEILFTPYFWVNPIYQDDWNRLVAEREQIARMNPVRAVKSMKGIAMEKYHALKHPYPSKLAILEEYGYDPKQLHHLLRVEEYLRRYIKGESYARCLKPRDPEYLKEVKLGLYNETTADQIAAESIERIQEMTEWFCQDRVEEEDQLTRSLLNSVQYDIMKTAVKRELS